MGEQSQIAAGDTQELHRCLDSFWKSGTLIKVAVGTIAAGGILTGGIPALIEAGAGAIAVGTTAGTGIAMVTGGAIAPFVASK